MLYDNNYIIGRSFAKYFIPSFLSILGGNFSILIDNLIAGRLIGSEALAAMSIVSPVFFVITTLGILINGGASTIASVAVGRGDAETVNQCFTSSVILTVSASALLSFFGILFQDNIAAFICPEPSLTDMTKEYCMALIPGAIGVMAVYIPLNFFRVEGRARIGMIMFLIMSALNILLDLLFVAYFGLGMFGLGLATVVSAAVSVIVCFPFLFVRGGGYRFTVIPDKRLLLKIAVIGSPLALTNFYSVIRVTVLNLCLINSGGYAAVAAFSFANSVNMTAQALISGVSQTVSPLTGVLWGEKDVKSVKKLVIHAGRVGLVSIAAYSICVAVFNESLQSMFGLPAYVRDMAGAALVICAASLIPAVINNIFVFYCMTIGRTAVANKIAFMRGLLFVIAAALILSAFFGAYGVWFAFAAGEMLTLLFVWYLPLAEQKRNSGGGGFLDSLLFLNTEEMRGDIALSFSVANNREAVIESSGRVTDFCEQAEMSLRQSMLVSLSIEEILLLMADHAFTDGKEHYIDVRIICGQTVVMRFRCDGRYFNPLEYYRKELTNDALMDYGESMGINMLLKTVKRIDYSTMLGFNNLIVEI